MTDFIVTSECVFPPHHCAVCNAHRGVFVDMRADMFGDRIYFCSDCVRGAAKQIGCRPPETAEVTERELEAALCRITDLEDELEAEKQNKTVSLDDARALLETWRDRAKQARRERQATTRTAA